MEFAHQRLRKIAISRKKAYHRVAYGTRVIHKLCLSSIILSPLNGNVNMSPPDTGDIHVDSDGIAKSERDQRVHRGRYGCPITASTPTRRRFTWRYAQAQGSGDSPTRYPKPAQSPSFVPLCAPAHR